MKKFRFCVPDVEHEGDIDYFRTIIIDAGGTIENTIWSGEDGDDAYIVFSVEDQNVERVKAALEDAK